MNQQIASADEILFAALQLGSTAELDEYLDKACGKESELRDRVEKLLTSYREAGEFLESPAVATIDHPTTSMVGTQIGPYKLREQIGEGGMGVVFVAEQTAPVKRKVALKVIRPGMASKDVVARFEAERQALAMMDHPNIARVFDGGTTAQGHPYFVMELVRGVPITDYCEQHQLDLPARLRLFGLVCKAVQHAHQKGIIHRDLKPSNIILAEIDDAPVPKVIDFGVAKALNQTLSQETVYTQFSQIVGTPLYMSPEQTGLGVIDIDTRSDVYSLGVLLYELLTGNTPFDSETLKQAGFDEMRRIIREDEPLKPSAMVSTLKAEALSTISQRRGSDPRKLCDSLSGELDWLVMRALEKDRNRRYESASALADDVERFLNQEPIAAGPPSAGYRVKKYAQRNKGRLIATALAATVLLIGGGITINAQVQQARQQRAIEQDVEQSLAEARTAIEARDLTLARQHASEAELRVEAAQGQLMELEAQVDAINSLVADQSEQKVKFMRFEELAREAIDTLNHDFANSGIDVPAYKAIEVFDIQENDRWLDQLEGGYLSDQQLHQLRETAYELLVTLAYHGVRWPPEQTVTSAQKSLGLLENAILFHEPTKAFFWVRSYCHNVLGNADSGEADRERFFNTVAKTAFDHYLPGHRMLVGDDYKDKESLEKEIRAYEKALSIQPDHFPSLEFLAQRMWQVGREEEAAQVYRACLALSPDNGSVRFYRSLVLRDLGKYGEATQELARAIELRGNFHLPGAYGTKAELHLRQDDYAQAIDDLNTAIELASSTLSDDTQGGMNDSKSRVLPILLFNRGLAFVCTSDLDQALADFQEVTRWDEEYESAYSWASYLQLDKSNSDLFDPAAALVSAKKAVDLAPEDSGSLATLAVAEYRAKDFEGAIKSCEKAAEVDEHDVSPRLILAMAFWHLDNREMATKWYKAATEIGPRTDPEFLKGINAYNEYRLMKLQEEATNLIHPVSETPQ